MALMAEKQTFVFDLSQIWRGCLLWGRHATWREGKAGFVTAATEGQLTVQYYPGIGNVTNHFTIPVSEVAGGEWEIRWSADMSEVWGHNTGAGSGQQGGEGDGGNGAGGADL